MFQLADDLENQRRRVVEAIGRDDYRSDTTLGIIEVIDIHFLIADFFSARGQHFVGVGPASLPLLHSALHRQFVANGARLKWHSPWERSATILFGLIKDHPFHDANKRTAIVSTLWLLQKHKLGPTASQKQLEDFVVEIADNRLVAKYARCRTAKEAGDDDAEVRFIAYWLKETTHRIEPKDEYRAITYRELRYILRQFDIELENPKDNHIDVVRVTRSPGFLGLGAGERRRRIGRIGYPSETREIARGDLRRVREICGLTYKNNLVDSRSFYEGINPMNFLLNEYQEILVQLADR